jgi:hypothetical protein
MSSVLCGKSVSTVTFTTDCLRHYFRIFGLSYHTFRSLDHRGINDRELGYLYHCNPFLYLLTDLMLTPSRPHS